MNDLLAQLPEHDPHPALWARIEAELAADEQLNQIAQELPQHEPRPNLWAAIEQSLDEPVTRPISVHPAPPTRRYRPFGLSVTSWAGLAAAAAVVLVGVWLLLRPAVSETVRVEYAVEVNQPTAEPFGDVATGADDRAEAFINRQCAEQQLACQRPEVHELRSQLTNLTAEQHRIDQERQTFGDDPALVRAQVKIENQRAEITRELITLLRS